MRLAREAAVADSALAILGVTLHPDPGVRPPAIPQIEPSPRTGGAPDPRLPGPDSRCPPLAPIRTAETAQLIAVELAT